MLSGHVMLLTPIVTILALLLYLYMGLQVGGMRGKHKIDAPAMTGHPEFECAVRVQTNTLEHLPIFLTCLWMATLYFSPAVPSVAWLPAALGLVWIVGRYLYMTGYMSAPGKRSTGFMISAVALITLIVLSVAGIVMVWMATNPAPAV